MIFTYPRLVLFVLMSLLSSCRCRPRLWFLATWWCECVETSRRSLRLRTILVSRSIDGSFVSWTFSDQLFSGQDLHPERFAHATILVSRPIVFGSGRERWGLRLGTVLVSRLAHGRFVSWSNFASFFSGRGSHPKKFFSIIFGSKPYDGAFALVCFRC